MNAVKRNQLFKSIGLVLLYLGIFIGNWVLTNVFTIEWLYSIFPTRLLDVLLFEEWGLWIVIRFFVPIFIIMLIFKIRKVKFFKFCEFNKMKKSDTVKVLLLSFIGSVFTYHFLNTSFALQYIPQFNEYVQSVVTGNFFSTFIMHAGFLCLCEELIFRGIVFNELKRAVPLIVVLFVHFLIYMPFNPNLNVAVFAGFNYLIYALVFIFVNSLWGSVIFQCLGAAALYGFQSAGLFTLIRGLGDVYLWTVTIVSLILVLYLVFSLKKAPLKEIFGKKRENKLCEGDLYEKVS